MKSDLLIVGLLLILVLVYFFFFKKEKRNKDKRSYYLKRFLRNKEQSLKFISEVETLANQNNAWEKEAFPDSAITFADYLKNLKSKYEQEYSRATYKALKRNRLSYAQKQEYTKRLIDQSEDLYLMEVDLNVLTRAWEKSAC